MYPFVNIAHSASTLSNITPTASIPTSTTTTTTTATTISTRS